MTSYESHDTALKEKGSPCSKVVQGKMGVSLGKSLGILGRLRRIVRIELATRQY